MELYKECRKCEVNKPYSEFSPYKKNTDGLFSYCKQCNKKAKAIWQKEKYYNDPIWKASHRRRQYRWEHYKYIFSEARREQVRKYNKEYYEKYKKSN